MEICMRRRQRGLQFYRKKKGLSMQAVKEVFSWIVLSVLAVFLAFMVIWAVGLRTNMIGVSMEPGLTNGQGILVNRLKYRFFSPQTGDVVVFLPNGNQNAHHYKVVPSRHPASASMPSGPASPKVCHHISHQKSFHGNKGCMRPSLPGC